MPRLTKGGEKKVCTFSESNFLFKPADSIFLELPGPYNAPFPKGNGGNIFKKRGGKHPERMKEWERCNTTQKGDVWEVLLYTYLKNPPWDGVIPPKIRFVTKVLLGYSPVKN